MLSLLGIVAIKDPFLLRGRCVLRLLRKMAKGLHDQNNHHLVSRVMRKSVTIF